MADPVFWSGGSSGVLTPGGPSPKFAQNGGFPIKLPENCMILKKILGARGAGPPGSACRVPTGVGGKDKDDTYLTP